LNTKGGRAQPQQEVVIQRDELVGFQLSNQLGSEGGWEGRVVVGCSTPRRGRIRRQVVLVYEEKGGRWEGKGVARGWQRVSEFCQRLEEGKEVPDVSGGGR